MKQLLKKRFPSLLLTLIMVMTMSSRRVGQERRTSPTPSGPATLDTSFCCQRLLESLLRPSTAPAPSSMWEFSVGTSSDYSDFEGGVACRGDARGRAALSRTDSKFYDFQLRL